MNHEKIKSVVFDQHEILKRTVIIDREYKFEKNANYVVVGIRRAGKSTILNKIVQELIAKGCDWNQIIYINFEDERLSEFTVNDFNDILGVQSELSNKKGYFFFDEVQNVKGWEKFARRMADSKERIYITGSNAKMLSREIEVTLGGRYFTKLVYPYNFREFLTANKVLYDEDSILKTKSNGKIRATFNKYFEFGGFPESLLFKDKREYVTNIYQKILLGDILMRNNIRNTNALKILMKKIAESVMTEVSYSKLFNILRTVGVSVSKDAIIDYVNYAKDAYLIFSIKNYVAKFAERESNPKYYFTDNGILNLFLIDKKTALLENIVAIDLMQKYKEEFYYFKSDKNNIDVDFYVPKIKTAIQVTCSLSDDSKEREIENLVRLSKKSNKINKFIILTYEEEKQIKVDGLSINVIPVWKWLIEQ